VSYLALSYPSYVLVFAAGGLCRAADGVPPDGTLPLGDGDGDPVGGGDVVGGGVLGVDDEPGGGLVVVDVLEGLGDTCGLWVG
jgi:hypothetical protein